MLCPERYEIIQFRLNKLDTKFLDRAKEIYGNLVVNATLCTGFVLPVYTCDILPGTIHFMTTLSWPEFPLERQRRTVVDLVKFVAKVAHFPEPKSFYNDASWTNTAETKLSELLRDSRLKTFEPEIYEKIAYFHSKLHLLETSPPVLMHKDLVSLNILVDDAGFITGVVNWEDAGVEAFSMVIFAVYECFLGHMERSHWSP